MLNFENMKKLILILIMFVSIGAYSQQSFNDLKVRNKLTVVNEIELDDSSVVAITRGDTLATKEWIIENAAILTGNPTEVYFNDNGILGSSPLFTYNELDSTLTVDSLLLANGEKISWNTVERTLNIPTGLGSVIQAGQEIQIQVYNNSGSLISNGTAVYPNGNFNDFPTIGLAKSSTHDSIGVDYGLTTTDVPIGGYGMVVWFGKANNVNTSSYSLGDTLYISPTNPGELTNVRPTFSDYAIQIGIVMKVGTTDGIIFVTSRATKDDTFVNFWNGVFREPFDFIVTESGGVITGTLTPQNGHPNMTMLFSDGFKTLDTNPGATVTLTAGTDINPQVNYVYIPRTTKVLTISTSDWPITEHIKVAEVLLQSAATTGNNGALRNQNWNDAIQGANSQGHLSHITEKLRQFEAQWSSGTEATLTGTTANVYINVTEGSVYQLHKQTYPAQSMPTDDITIVNDAASAYASTTNLNTLTNDALGNTLNNKWFTLIIWGVANKAGEPSHLMCNLPTGSYNSESDAIADGENYSVYDIPSEFQGVGFLIARFVIRKAGTVYTYNGGDAYLDLRGKIPNTTAGAGTGSSGVTTFLGLTDTESSYTAYEFQIANAGATALESPSGLTYDGNTLNVNYKVTTDTISSDNLDALSIYAGGKEIARAYENVTEQFIINPQGDLTGTAVAPSLGFGDGDTGPFENIDDVIYWSFGGSTPFQFTSSGIRSITSTRASIRMATTPSSTNPNFHPNGANTGTGMGGAPNEVSLIANSIEGIKVTEDTVFMDSTLKVKKLFVDGVEITGGGVSFGTKHQIPRTNSTGTDFDYSGNLTWNDTTLTIKSSIGGNNICIGENTGKSLLTTSDGNLFAGYNAGNASTGDQNTFIGSNAGSSNTTSSRNTFVGNQAGKSNTTGEQNTYIGDECADSNNGSSNVFVGALAGFFKTTGNNNVFLGHTSGYNNTSGSGNIFLGYQSGRDETGSNKLYIENSSADSDNALIYGEFDNDIVKINGTQIQSTGTIADNDATPDVSASNVWTYNGTANSVTVTDLDNPDVGAIYRIIGNSDTYTITINDSGNFNLSANWVGGVDDVLTIFVQADNDYIEISRSDN
jgi:hypothetical protein